MDTFSGLCYPVNATLLYREKRSIRTTVMQQIMRILAEHLINALVSQSAETRRVAERASVFEINSVNGFLGGVKNKSESVFALAYCLFCTLALGDVYIDADHAYWLTRRASMKNLPAPCDPMNAPVSPDHPPFTLR